MLESWKVVVYTHLRKYLLPQGFFCMNYVSTSFHLNYVDRDTSLYVVTSITCFKKKIIFYFLFGHCFGQILLGWERGSVVMNQVMQKRVATVVLFLEFFNTSLEIWRSWDADSGLQATSESGFTVPIEATVNFNFHIIHNENFKCLRKSGTSNCQNLTYFVSCTRKSCMKFLLAFPSQGLGEILINP